MTDIQAQVIECIAQQLQVSRDDITESANIIEDLGADSLDIVEIVMGLEEQFDISIEDAAAEQMNTVQDVIAYVEKAKA